MLTNILIAAGVLTTLLVAVVGGLSLYILFLIIFSLQRDINKNTKED